MMNLNVKLNDGTIGLMKIVIVAGGTGGHIYPALTLAEELEKRGNEIVFFGSIDRYGTMPTEVENLIEIARIKIFARNNRSNRRINDTK